MSNLKGRAALQPLKLGFILALAFILTHRMPASTPDLRYYLVQGLLLLDYTVFVFIISYGSGLADGYHKAKSEG